MDQQLTLSEGTRSFLKEAWRTLSYLAERYAEYNRESPPPDPEDARHLGPGAHIYPDGRVDFVLFAPGKESVAVAGDFNDWSPDALPLQHIENGLWWGSTHLDDGEHTYQYVVDGGLWICDPYAREVHWDASGPKARIRVGHEPYQWNDEGFHPRPLEDLIIYEVHVGDFTPEGTFDAMRQRLDYLAEMGITAIELMPVAEFPMDRSWGYNPAFFFATEAAYGTPDDFKRLVDEAHQRGIAVILDMVFNHSHQDSPLNQMWPYDENPYFSGDNPWGMPDFNHFSDVTKSYIRDVQDYWLRECHVDGFRYDATAYIESDVTNGIGFFTWAARQTNPNAYLIAEHLPQDPWWIHNTEMDAQWHDTFHDVLKAQLREGTFEDHNQWGDLDAVERALYYALDGFAHPRQVINYTASHDEERVVHEALTNPWLNEDIAYRKAALGMATVIGAAGVPMLYSGEEIGMERERTTGEVNFEWERLEGGIGRALHDHWKRLTWLRNTHPALRSPNYATLAKWYEQKAIAFQRWNDNGDVVVVVLNFSNESFNLPLRMPQAGTWWEYIYDYAQETDADGNMVVELPPSGAKFFCSWKNWE